MSGSESCPDADTVFRSMALLFPERSIQRIQRVYDLRHADTNVHVTVRPLANGYEAHIKLLGPRSGERLITEPDANCRGLADALAVALTMLVDPPGEPPRGTAGVSAEPSTAGTPPQPEEQATSPGTKPTTTTPAPVLRKPTSTSTRPKKVRRSAPVVAPAMRTQTVAAPHQPKTNHRAASVAVDAATSSSATWSSHARLGALMGYRLLSEPELGMIVGADLFHSPGLGLELGALGTWVQPAENRGGSIRQRRFGALLGACYAGAAWTHSEYQLCIEFGIGALSTKTESFAIIYEPERLDAWLTAGPKLGYLHKLSRGLDAFVSVAALANLTRDRYLVQTSGPLTQSQAFGIMSEIGIRLSGPSYP
ncbi:MAG TPA: hypothetical protein VKP30_27120 [Polyangiaceae bacterium]|nr:hypothetical protein [Polyangiaceae bacterium]